MRKFYLRKLTSAVVLAVLLFAGVASPSPVTNTESASSAAAASPGECGPNDAPETGLQLQGQVPWADRISGRAAQGYNCNLEIVGEFPSASFANFDSYENCVYYTDNTGGMGVEEAEGGAVVLDVSDPANPVQTDYLRARAMRNSGESLRVNTARGLLVADYYNKPYLAVYDISEDCRHPKLLADVEFDRSVAVGHEGCFQPDGYVYYMAELSQKITPIDLTDPRNPTPLSAPWNMGSIHGCSISDDGNRGYFARTDDGGEMIIVDTSQVQQRRRDATFEIIGRFSGPGVQQSTYPLSYDGHPYVFNWSEFAGPQTCQSERRTNFGMGWMIDIADETNPIEVAGFQTEVMLPQNCPLVVRDHGPHTSGVAEGDGFWTVGGALFLYDMHYCRPDRLHEPTVMACANFGSGLRVFDIRDPRHPREIAYYNTGTASPTNPSLDYAVSPPVIRRDLGMIFWVTLYQGFHAAKFRDGVWPFKGDDPCPSGSDYFAEQYDMSWTECRASRGQPPSRDVGRRPDRDERPGKGARHVRRHDQRHQ